MLVVSLLFLAVWGWCLCESDCARPQSLTRREPWTVFATIAAAAVLVWFACINPVRANALAGWANALNGGGKLSAAVGVYRRAVDLDPHAYVYRFELAELLAASAGKAAFDENMAEAESLLKEGRKISSLDQGALILGDIYERWAAAVNRPARRLALAMQARRSFEAALAFKPAEEFALVDMAALDELLLNDPIGAADALKRADTLVPDRAASDWFDYYAQESARSSLPEFRRFYAKRALWCCGEALESAARQNQSEFSLIVRRGMLHSSLGELRLALADYRLAVNEDHDPDDWKAEALLAQTYGELGDRDSAIWHAGEAIDKAPEGVRPTLEALRARVGGP
jgi:tetratricopeptide (TPR) repeat protein